MTDRTKEIPLDLIDRNPNQPRKVFRQEALEELAASIKKHEVLEPIVVAPRGKRYLLVAGERRWRASKLAGKKTIPAHIRNADDRVVQELALLENIQREDLTPMEEARAYQDFLDRGYTVESLAELLGFKHTKGVTHRLRLLRLRPRYQEAYEKGWLTDSQAIHICKLEPEEQDALFRSIRDGKCETEEKLKAFVGAIQDAKAQSAFFEIPPPDPKAKEIHAKYTRMLDKIGELLRRSFDSEDLTVLRRALEGDVAGNLERLDLIVDHLARIRKAMQVQAASEQLALTN